MSYRSLVTLQITASLLVLCAVVWSLWGAGLLSVNAPEQLAGWHFVVSGDSRNCGDVVMPTIAAHSLRYGPAFYWHLGDLRAIYKIDEDMQADYANGEETLSCEVYQARAWSDFVRNQIAPFGKMPFYLGIGNHEVIPPKTEGQFTGRFKEWLASNSLNKQRLEDGEKEPLPARPYYHWIQKGVDFIYLDNASDSFSAEQLDWFDQTLARDEADRNGILSVVVGMHEALPDSIASNHSMCDDQKKVDSCTSGKHVYEALLKLQKKKAVYVLASHSHFYMERIFDDLPLERRVPGWIVGTAGAVRYKLPPNVPPTSSAKTDVYGYLLGTVKPNGGVQFEFQEVKESDVPDSVWQRYSPSLIRWCFARNSQNRDPNGDAGAQRCTPPAAPTAGH
jgi:3',5'-cyclic AMP phosphodiesterase CpdA